MALWWNDKTSIDEWLNVNSGIMNAVNKWSNQTIQNKKQNQYVIAVNGNTVTC